MKVGIYTISDLKPPYKDLVSEYLKRITLSLKIHEFSVKGNLNEQQLKFKESQLLLNAAHPDAYRIVLDERGDELSSQEFSRLFEEVQMNGLPEISFFIGGAFGHDKSMREKAHKIIAFGKMTWPHQFIRVMLVEQIYRAQQIMKGHPYHK